MERFRKAFFGLVFKEGSTYNVQKALNVKGYFMITATPIWANLFLMEESSLGDINTMIKEDEAWVKKWFDDIHPWLLADIDNERLTWMKCYGLSCHA
ncbi:unnamed protein product [Lathyrus sativus]|nr:unnamed protein product [Lathyrus sativus]